MHETLSVFRASAGAWGWHPEDADLPHTHGPRLCPTASCCPFPGGERAVLGVRHMPRQQPWAAMLWGAVGGLGWCHVHAKHQEAHPGGGHGGLRTVLVGQRVAVPTWRAGSQHGDDQPGSCLPGCQYPALGPLSSKTIPGVL